MISLETLKNQQLCNLSSETQQRDLQKDNESLAKEILEQLNVGHFSSDCDAPINYFDDSYFWAYSSPAAKLDWNYCFSMFRSKEEVIPNVYIGTEDYALLGELCGGDYSHKSNDYYAENDPGMFLSFKNQDCADLWVKIKNETLGSSQVEVPFKRVISVSTNAMNEQNLRSKLIYCGLSGYSKIKEEDHKFVQLRDLPKGEFQVQDQLMQWNYLKTDFESIFAMIDAARMEGQPILIHCQRGRHRSAAILAAYLIDRMKLSAKEALSYICLKRGCAIPYGPPNKGSEFSALLDGLAK